MTDDHANIDYRVLLLDKEMERTRERLHKLEADVAGLTLTTVKRDGPLIDELRALEQKVNDLATLDQVREAVNHRTVSFGAKLWAVVLALTLIALQILNTVRHF